MENPWQIRSIYDLQYFNCPSCIFKNYSKQEIVNHAYHFHPESIENLMNISDNSLMDISLPWDMIVKKEIENEVEQNKKYALNIENLPGIKSEPFDDITENDEFGKDPLGFEINDQMEDLHENYRYENNKCAPINKINIKNENKTIMTSNEQFAHEGLNKHQCNFCKKQFTQTGDLKKHIKAVHEKIKDFQCDYCEKSFSQAGNLIRHIKSVHEGIKNHKCGHCGKSFSHAWNLTEHIKTVHDEIKVHKV